MGNIIKRRVNYSAFSFITGNKRNNTYCHTIEIEKLDIDEIENIKNKLLKINDNFIKQFLNDIIEILNFYIEDEAELILLHMDSFLFIHSEIELLEIINVNSTKNKEQFCCDTNTYYYKKCDLSKVKYICV
jgi:hypothetical protein